MASIGHLRARRSAAQLHALAGVEREIRANDHNGRRKYLRDFADAFRAYECVLDANQVQEAAREADVVLIGDYHALPACQRYAGEFLERRALAGDRPVVLSVETIFARDQHLLEEWWRREIEPDELRERMRFDREWGYEWAPFYDLLVTAREHGEAIYGLDCAPREDLRKIGARDRHAAEKIADIRDKHPSAVIVVLFGESHLAPGHLPLALGECLPEARVLSILQNVDALYWSVAGERRDHVPAVRVDANVLCVFNATPLEKYENYRLCLERWRQEDAADPDLGPTLNNLIDGLVGFLGINRYSSHNRTQPRFLVDLLPEVYGPASDGTVRRLLARRGMDEGERHHLFHRIEQQGCVYLPEINSVCAAEFRMEAAAEAAARFLHHACRGLPERTRTAAAECTLADHLYRNTIEDTLAYFGSRVLHPGRAAWRESDVRALADRSRDELERETGVSGGDALRALEFVLRHRELETKARNARQLPEGLESRVFEDGPARDLAALQLGSLLGYDLYDAYIEGRLGPAGIRGFFLLHLEKPGEAQEAYFEMVRRVRTTRRRPHRTGQSS
jgi:hypothetical protein